MRLVLDVQQIVAELGGPSTAARYLSSHGFKVTVKAVSAWQVRNSLPMDAWLAICAAVFADRNKRLNLWDYIEVRQK